MYLCNSKKYIYRNKYIHLPIPLDESTIPHTINVEDTSLILKSSFHVSLVCIKNLEEKNRMDNLEEKVLEIFCNFQKENNISFEKFTGEFRFAERSSDNRKSLVAMCDVSNLDLFYNILRDKFDIQIDNQPTHVSLYTLELNKAIGINNKSDLDTLTKKISLKENLNLKID